MEDDLIIGNEAAAAYVHVSVNSWRPYVARGQAPAPTDRIAHSGHALPIWRRRDLDEWMANRPGRGAPGRPRSRTTVSA